ncbi:hypothetical protein HanXRQr2_Chr15g0684311 [Helianthus annuus]|uniref:Uncharacterized protein n=1 Tax=Helianthus annuus TaxID=4232 RepID=A0A251S702_HELAN|nr:hypothetical protein HanXRQr2_Chr15g0684311 [Helianthus annuus]KAJ0450544.1 hypothetical protein HanHA300_Chr15g0557481 [Helianthus annuus]KAJ0472394.1 hypothetical protein HanHA89_Chr15g0606571 [Helianthus annuus]KAJ0647993.1 hypothetical protein HanLR1_Chr15g0567911 [Helianthus annuus]KAJ0651846.1 hypothetical protein HanOQP8_Chr15g0565491 [Helianthus annuus]
MRDPFAFIRVELVLIYKHITRASSSLFHLELGFLKPLSLCSLRLFMDLRIIHPIQGFHNNRSIYNYIKGFFIFDQFSFLI